MMAWALLSFFLQREIYTSNNTKQNVSEHMWIYSALDFSQMAEISTWRQKNNIAKKKTLFSVLLSYKF